MKYFLSDAVRFLESIGFEFRLAEDGRAEITYPVELTGRDIARVLQEEHAEELTQRLRRRAEAAAHVLVGGPFDGEPHSKWKREMIALHVARARWAVYLVGDDFRARFPGYTTSKQRARRWARQAIAVPPFRAK